MDDSRYNAYGSHCLNDAMMQLPSPMGESEKTEVIYLLRRINPSGETEYISSKGTWRGDRQRLMDTYIDRRDAQRAIDQTHTGFEIEEIQGLQLTEKLKGKQGIKFHFVEQGISRTLDIPEMFITKYDEYHQQRRPKVSTSEFLASFPKVKDIFPPRKMKTIRDTFEGLDLPGAVVTVATLNLLGSTELVIDFAREGGFNREDMKKIDQANRRLMMRFGHPSLFYTNADIDLSEPAPEPRENKPESQRDPAEVERIRLLRENRKQKRKNGKPAKPDDGFVCAEFNRKILKKQKTMEHPFVAHLAKAFETRTYEPLDPAVLDDEAFDLLLHLDLEGEYIVSKDGIDIFIDEVMWKRAHDPKIHEGFQGQKTIRDLLEFAVENDAPLRLFYPDRDQISFISVPFEQVQSYYEQMPRSITSDLETLRSLPRDITDAGLTVADKAHDQFRGVPGTSTTAYVVSDDGRPVLVVEVEPLKQLSDTTDNMLFGRSESLRDQLPHDITYRFKILPLLNRDPGQDPVVK